MLTTFGGAPEPGGSGSEGSVPEPFAQDRVRRVGRQRASHQAPYASRLEGSRLVRARRLEEARRTLFQAIALDPQRPQAFHLLGECPEAAGKTLQAQRNDRAALALDPTFRPALDNLHRTVSGWSAEGRLPPAHGRDLL